MSELTQTNRRNFRWELLTTASALALAAYVATAGIAQAEDADRPTVWIELGGQLQRVDGREDPFAPPFTQISPQPGPFKPGSPTQAQRAARYGIGGEGRISFQPEDSDWVFSAAVRYGRANRNRLVHQQTAVGAHFSVPTFAFYGTYTSKIFADSDVHNSSSQTILDFKAGRDVGLGLFGKGMQSVFSVGLRIAQMTSKSNVEIHARPDFEFGLYPFIGLMLPMNLMHHDYVAGATTNRSFKGVGPSLSWDGTAPLLRDSDDATINVDWGLSGAILFGRQKSSGVHHTTKSFYERKYHPSQLYGSHLIYANSHRNDRSRSVIVPNIGGFAGLSYRFSAAKLSLGYRADFFFGVMDGGIDARKTYDRNFHGPFATISIGLGG